MSRDPLVTGIVQTSRGPVLATLALRTDAIASDGETHPIDAPQDFDPSALAGWSPMDDLSLDKPCTDVVVAAHAHAGRGKPVRRMSVAVALPQHGAEATIRVIGHRRCRRRAGHWQFDEPEPFVTMPVDWQYAYGGIDPTAGAELPSADVLSVLLAHNASRGAYPRNSLGCGWIIDEGTPRTDEVELPNLEDPDQLLTPETLPVAHPGAWARQPIPRSFGWVDPGWFPRCVHAGVVPPADEIGDPKALPECRRGWLAPADLRTRRDALELSPRFWSGAAPGLAAAPLRGGEILHTRGLDPRGEFLVRLPIAPPPPSIRVGAGVLEPGRWVVHTACVDLVRARIHVLWRMQISLPSRWRRADELELDLELAKLLEDTVIRVPDRASDRPALRRAPV